MEAARIEAGLGALSGPALLLIAAALGLLAVALWDLRRRTGPRARTAARLETLIGRDADADRRAVAERIADLDLFRLRRAGLRGALAERLADLSANIGGTGALRALAAVSAAAGLGGALGAGAGFGAPAPVAAAAGLGLGALAFSTMRGELRRRWSIGFLDLLVEAVELLTRTVRAGYAAPAAIRLVGREIPAPVGPVFAQIADEDDLGVDFRRSLRGAARRVGLPDFNFLAVALILQRETGGQLGDSLDNLHLVLRKRKEARLKVQALTAEGRTSAMIVGAIPFAAGGGVSLVNPEQTALLLEPGAGRLMLAGAGGLLVAGFFTIRWMVKARP
jgi:Flp pilus assembly protein TadB